MSMCVSVCNDAAAPRAVIQQLMGRFCDYFVIILGRDLDNFGSMLALFSCRRMLLLLIMADALEGSLLCALDHF